MKGLWLFLPLIAVPYVVHSDYALHLFILVLLAIALGEAWNLVGGWAGQYSVGHSAYYGVGAYATLLLLQTYHWIPPFGAAVAAIFAVVVSVVIGGITFRLRGAYFVLASIAVAEILRLWALAWKGVTNGAEGILITDVPPVQIGSFLITDWSSKAPWFFIALMLAFTSVVVNLVVQRTKLGYMLLAIREDQDAAWSLGIPLALYKGVALAVSAGLTALVGSATALYVTFLDPSAAFGLDISVQAVLIGLLGGLGTVWGPVAGAVVITLLGEGLRAWLSQAHALVYGLILVLAILFMPEGLAGVTRRVRWRRGAA